MTVLPLRRRAGTVCIMMLSQSIALVSCGNGGVQQRVLEKPPVDSGIPDSADPCLQGSSPSCTPMHTEGGAATGACVDDGAPIASTPVLAQRLARFIWNLPAAPQSLLDETASINSSQAMVTLAAQMLTDSRARDGVSAFFANWLRLGDLAALQKPGSVMTPELAASMQAEAPAFGVSVVLDGDARYRTLMLAPYTYANHTLATHYGVSGISGPEMQRMNYGTPDRVGILMGAGALTRFAGSQDPPWPPRRYWLTFETLLCNFGTIPIGAVNNALRNPAFPSIRDDLLNRTQGPQCMVCHSTVSPVGLAYSSFDSFGRSSADPTIVTGGTIPAGLGVAQEMTVTNAADMIKQLVEQTDVRKCFSWRWLSYALHPAPLSADALVSPPDQATSCSLGEAHAAFEASGGNIRSLISAITGTPAFMAPDL